MPIKKYTFLITSLLLLIGGAILLTPILTQAQVSLGLPTDVAGLSTQDIKTSIGNIVAVIFGFLGILLVLLLLYGGFLWMTSQGNEQQIEKAKQVIISAVIGLIITLAAYSLAAFIITSVQRATGPGGPGGPPPPPPTPCPTCPTNCTNPGPGGPIKVCELKGLTAGTAGRGGTVTAVGYNFGAYDAANSQVIFQAATPVVAEFAQCNSVVQWTDNKIVFKVPSSINPGNFLVEVKNAAQSCTSVGGLCQTLAVNNTSQPNLNCIDPTFGPSGTSVTLQGSNFGQSQDTVEMEGANGRFSIGPSNITSWQADQIKITIPGSTPEPALSGDITVKVGSQSSNGQYFTVSCTTNTQCASNCCSNSSCQAASVCAANNNPPGVPSISSISPDNGEVGNFITIRGSNFGSTSGTVHFQVGATDYTVTTPPAAACNTTWWGDKQIVVAVPAAIGQANNGAAAVTVENTTGESGSVNFDINDTVRPGLCALNPAQGLFKDTITVTGVNFTGPTRTIQFGGIDGDSVSFASATVGSAKVPNIQPATIGVTAKIGSESSNPLSFVVGTTATGQAHIDYISPTSGPAAQYVQIYGSNFGNSAGVVRFIKGVDTFIGDTGFPAACSTNFWHNDHIVVKVPSDATATIGQYQVQVHPASGPDSNLVDFSKNNNSLSPGICALNPVKGPVNTPVTVSGDAFATPGQVIFSNNKTATINGWSNQQIQTAVPNGAVTGLVKVSLGAVESAGVPFEVGSCTNSTQCPSGSQCCGDGTCQTSCTPTAGPQCKYRWSFTTGQNPFTLDIIAQCTATGQSPSPYPFYQLGGYDVADASKNAPVDSAIAARFTADLDFSSIGSGSDFSTYSIVVYRCNTGATPNEATCVNPVDGTFSQWAGSKGFMFDSAATLAPATWYKVELNANGRYVLARDGSRLQLSSPLDTGWLFRTRDAAQATCQPTSLSVAPGSQTLYLGNSAQYSAAALDSSSCTFCHSGSLTWNWSQAPAAPNALVSLNTNNNQVTVTADQDKIGSGTIRATLVNSPLPAGQANLEVKSGDAFVTTFSPGSSCVSACTNSEIRANFNMPMSQTSVEQANAIEVRSCTDANCTTLGGAISVTVSYQQDTAGQRAVIVPDSNLSADTWYRVIVKGSLTNSYGTPLTHLNYPIALPDSFSWKFKTGNSSCTPDAVSLTPDTYTAQVGQNINYTSSVLVNTIPNCSTVNLNAASYAWTWSSADPTVASIASSNANQAVVTANSLSLPTGVAIRANLNAFPAITPASGILYVTNGNGVPVNGPPLALVGHTPTGSPVCRNAEVSSVYNNQLEGSFSFYWQVSCNPGPCPQYNTVVQDNKVFYRFKNPQSLWPANSDITVRIQTGVRDIYGQVWAATGNPNETWTFHTTDSICKIGYVEVTPHPYTFTTPNSTIVFTGQAKASDGTAISGADYLWTQNTGPIISVPPWTTQNADITSQNKNGTDYAYVEASGTLAGQDLGQATGHARINVNICENPWTLSPYVDSQYDFSFRYCKDSLSPGSNDLPNLPAPIIRTPNSSGSGDVLKEHVFVVDPTKAGGSVVGGANQDPVFDTEPSSLSAKVGDFVQFQLKATDPEGDQFVMVADDTTLPTGASFNPYNGVFIWVPQNAGTFLPRFYLRNNGSTNVATKTVTLTINSASSSLVIPKVTMALPFNGTTIYANVGEEKNFTAGLLPTPSATIDSFVWDFQDSGETKGYTNNGTSFSVKHTFAQVGVKQVTFRAKAVNGGWSQPAVVTVIVRRPVSWLSPLEDYSRIIGSKLLSLVPKKLIDTVIAQAPGQSYDVIVVRVMKNIEHLSPLEWYRKYAPNPNGSPVSLQVNGYPAIQDGTTTYVAAANIPGGNVNGSPVYTNIYLISYNASAQTTTKKIVQQLIDTWSFNDSFTDGDNFNGAPATCHVNTSKLCNTDEECGAGDYCLSQKAVIRRDVARYTRISSIGRSLNEYAVAHRFCQNNPTTPCQTNSQCGAGGLCLPFYPKLSSGSYVAGMSTSKWPSWQQTFATVLGGTQPVDPINTFESCANNAFAPYDPETCWDAVARKFSCPSDASVFVYQVQQDTSYRLSTNLETNSRFNWAKENQNLAFTNAAVCTGAPQAGICGNGVLESGEVCDGGFTNACPVGSNNQQTVGCQPDCQGWLTVPGLDCGGACGNGQLDTPFEQCDVSGNSFVPTGWNCSLGGTVSCGNQCLFNCSVGQPYKGRCGDQIVQLPEVCDDGSANGGYDKCNATCSGYGEFCGDGVVNGTEECDGSQGLSGHSCPANQSLYCNSACQRDCSDLSPASVTPGVCGNNVVEPANGEQCEPDLYVSPSPEQSNSTDRQYVCGDTSAGALACKITGGYCNDGTVQVPYESCDYTNQNRCSNDSSKICSRAICPEGQPCSDCPDIVDPVNGPKGVCNLKNGEVCNNLTANCTSCLASCQLKVTPANRCGDGVKAGNEVCDEGPNNGLPAPHCNSTCTAGGIPPSGPVCGNGSPASGYPGTPEFPPEICDEGSALNGTVGHCNGTCTGLISPNLCGNGSLDGNEVCDEGDQINGQPLHCNLMCSGWTTASCGNGIPEPQPFGNEECDLGAQNGQPGSTCSNQCIIVPPIPVTGAKVCGDGTADTPNDAGVNEVCDNGSANGTAGNCWTDCTRYTKYCGDGQKQTPNDTTPSQTGFNEFCDNGSANGTAVGLCNTTCTALVTQICNDHVISGTESCDLCSPLSNTTNYCKAGNVPLAAGESCSPSCVLIPAVAGEICNNGIREGFERCDFGLPQCNIFQHICFSPATDAVPENGWCLQNCYTFCGDGQWFASTAIPPDSCDLGYGVNGMTIGQCNASCTGVVKYNCGDNVVTPNTAEICDDGLALNGTTGHCGPGRDQPVEKYGVETGCTSCSNVACGDSIISQSCNPATSVAGDGEKCDLGANNGVPGSNCNQWCSGKCGDGGTPDPGEVCDEGALNGQPGHCNNTCSGQTAAVCGNDSKETGEYCDFGPGSELNSCTASNPTNPANPGERCCYRCGSTCGDRLKSVLEFCDDPNGLNGQPGKCNTTCTAIVPAPSCGDNIINGTEQCDGNQLNGATCQSLGFVSGGPVTCYPANAPANQACTFNTSSCVAASSCGDNQVTGSEVCDYGAPGTQYKHIACSAAANTAQGLATRICINCAQEITTPTCVPFGPVEKTREANVTYFNGKLLLYPQCTADVPDQQGLTYPDASVSYPATGNACNSNNIPGGFPGASNETDTHRGWNQIASWEVRNGINVVGVKVVGRNPSSLAVVSILAFASPANNAVYYGNNFHVGKYASSPWVCANQSSGLAADNNGKKWYEAGFDATGWGAPTLIPGPASCRYSSDCSNQQNLTLGSCPTTPVGKLNSYIWGPGGCIDDTFYCRLEYWAN